MAADDVHRHEGGPLERSHMKDMVQRNALESVAYNKVAKHLENQKRAFVRQNTRDEGEMKNLLYRLQMEQHSALNDTDIDPGGIDSDVDEVDGTGSPHSAGRAERETVANPYPVTIIPRFGGNTHIKQSVSSSSRETLHRPGSSRFHCRRKSVEYEDIQESLSSMTVSDLSSASVISEQISSSFSSLSHDDHATRDWLATPGAISSVRRQRKSVTEQANKRLLRKTSCEHSEVLTYSSSPPSHSRNNSLKEKKKSVSGETTSPKLGYGRRRGGSLKERKTSTSDRSEYAGFQPLSRSYSMLSKTMLSDHGKKQEVIGIVRSAGNSEEGLKLNRKNSKKCEKQRLSRKTSSDSTSSIDTGSPSQKKTNVRRKLGVPGSEESSPVVSPLSREVETFKF